MSKITENLSKGSTRIKMVRKTERRVSVYYLTAHRITHIFL